jgi:hypothetical protein
MKKFSTLLLVILLVSLVAIPSFAQAPAGKDQVRLKVFIHYPKGQAPVKPDNPGKPPKPPKPTPTPAPSGCNLGYDEDDVADYGIIGWKLPTTITYHVNYNSIPASVTNPKPAISDSFGTWQTAGSNAFRFVEGSATTLTRYKFDGVNLVAWGRVSASNAIAITYTWYYPSTGQVAEVDTIMNVALPWAQTYVSSPDTSCGNPAAYDVQNILTHEVGHWVGLDDLYDSKDEDLTMYGYGELGEVKKDSLGNGDILGVRAIY